MKLFIAGTASFPFIATKYPPKYVLESFYYIKEWQLDYIHKWDMFLLDSGAFTFMNSCKGKVDFNDYLERYIDFINKYDIKYFFELDIDSVVGYEEVLRLRKRLEEGTHKKCIPVWHFNRGKEEFIKMCKEYDYVAFGGILTDGISTKEIVKYLPWFVHTAHKYGARIHGLGLTVQGVEKLGLDSADSTSWTAASKFGSISYFDGTKMAKIPSREGKKTIWRTAMEYSFKEWVKYQEYLDK